MRKTKLRRMPSSRPMPGEGELERGDIGEDLAAVLAQLAEFVVGELAVIFARVLSRGEDADHFLRFHRHHRLEGGAVDDRENGGVDPDGEGEGEDRDGSEARRLESCRKANLKSWIMGFRWDADAAPFGFKILTESLADCSH